MYNSSVMVKKSPKQELEVEACLDRIDRLLVDDPDAALKAAALLPMLVTDYGRAIQARAYSCLGTAHFRAGNLDDASAAFRLAGELSIGTGSSTRALIKLRSASLAVGAGCYDEAETMLGEALKLAGDESSGPLLGRIHIKQGHISFLRGDFAVAAERFGLAFDTLPSNHYLRSCAAWNLMLAVYHLDHRQAQSLLGFMSYHELRCRRRISKRRKKTVSDCMICWAEGYLCGVMGYLPHAERCLSWAANALFKLGAAREAALCALDLISFEPGGLRKVHEIVSALADDPATPPTTRDAARLWLASTGTDQAKILRDLLLQAKKVGVESD